MDSNARDKIKDIIINDVQNYKQNNIHIVNKTYPHNILIDGLQIDLNEYNNSKKIITKDSFVLLKNISINGIIKNDAYPVLNNYDKEYNEFLNEQYVRDNILNDNTVNNLTIDDFSLHAENSYQIEYFKMRGENNIYINYNKTGQPYIENIDYNQNNTVNGVSLPYNLSNYEINSLKMIPYDNFTGVPYSVSNIKRIFFKDINVNSVIKGVYFDYKEFFKNVRYILPDIKITFKFSSTNELIMVKEISYDFFKPDLKAIKTSDLTVLDNAIFKNELVITKSITDTAKNINKYKNRLKDVDSRRTNIIDNISVEKLVENLINKDNPRKHLEKFVNIDMDGTLSNGMAYRNDFFARLFIDGDIVNDVAPRWGYSYTSIINTITYNSLEKSIIFTMDFNSHRNLNEMGWLIPSVIIRIIQRFYINKSMGSPPHDVLTKYIKDYQKKYMYNGKFNIFPVINRNDSSDVIYNTKKYTLYNITADDRIDLLQIFSLMNLF